MGKVADGAQPRLRALRVLDVKICPRTNFNTETAEDTEGLFCCPIQLARHVAEEKRVRIGSPRHPPIQILLKEVIALLGSPVRADRNYLSSSIFPPTYYLELMLKC